jgi:hypothetical protein
VKGRHTYVVYFTTPLDWYPEWDLDLGRPQKTASTIEELRWNGLYRREFDRGVVLLNPGDRDVSVKLGSQFRRVVPTGGGPVPKDGAPQGRITTASTTFLTVAPKSAEILLR